MAMPNETAMETLVGSAPSLTATGILASEAVLCRAPAPSSWRGDVGLNIYPLSASLYSFVKEGQ